MNGTVTYFSSSNIWIIDMQSNIPFHWITFALPTFTTSPSHLYELIYPSLSNVHDNDSIPTYSTNSCGVANNFSTFSVNWFSPINGILRLYSWCILTSVWLNATPYWRSAKYLPIDDLQIDESGGIQHIRNDLVDNSSCDRAVLTLS